jgi:hypothetical protein
VLIGDHDMITKCRISEDAAHHSRDGTIGASRAPNRRVSLTGV